MAISNINGNKIEDNVDDDNGDSGESAGQYNFKNYLLQPWKECEMKVIR